MRPIALLLLISSCYGADVTVYFSPKGGCEQAIVKEIFEAKATILVQSYSFTSRPICDALIAAHRRGVKVEACIDGKQRTAKGFLGYELQAAGIPVLMDDKHAIAHSKTMTIDSQVVIAGSYNFSEGAQSRNLEDLLIIRDADLSAKYRANFEEHKAHCVPLEKSKPKEPEHETLDSFDAASALQHYALGG